jgi:hypothetical protein
MSDAEPKIKNVPVDLSGVEGRAWYPGSWADLFEADE